MNVAIRVFMNATLKTAVHLGNDHDVNLRRVKNSFLEVYRTTFRGDRKVDQWSDKDCWFQPD